MNGFITTNLQENEIVKASDVQLGGDNGIENLEKFYKVLLKADKNTVIGGKIRPVTDGSGLKAKMDPIMGIHAETEKVFMDHEGKFYLDGDKDLSDIISFADAETDIRRDIVEVKADTITALEQSRQFYNPDTETTSYSFTDIQKRQILRLKVKKGITGSDVAPETDEGYVKLCEVVIPAYTLSLEDSNILNITADESNGENSAWTIEKDSTVNPGTIKDIKDIFRTIHNADGTLKNNVVSAEKILLSGEGALRGSIIEIGGGNVVINGVTYGPSTSISDIIATLNNKVIPVSQGGTGATTQVEAQHNLFDNAMMNLDNMPLVDDHHFIGWYSSAKGDPLFYTKTFRGVKDWIKSWLASDALTLGHGGNIYNGTFQGNVTGTFTGSPVGIAYGGTGATTQIEAQHNLFDNAMGDISSMTLGDEWNLFGYFSGEKTQPLMYPLKLYKLKEWIKGWINKADVGLDRVDNTADSTKFVNGLLTTAAPAYGEGSFRYVQFIGSQSDTVYNPTANEWYSHIVMSHANAHGYYWDLAFPFDRDEIYFRRLSDGVLSGWGALIHSGNIGAQSVANANTVQGLSPNDGTLRDGIVPPHSLIRADNNGYVNVGFINTGIHNDESVDFTSVYISNDNYIRKCSLDRFRNKLGWVGSSDVSSHLTIWDGGWNPMYGTFNWVGQDGQPSWLWGGNDGINMYVYDPSNFNVNHAHHSSQLKSLDGVPGALIVGVFIPSFNGVQYNVAGSLVTSTYYEDQYGKHYRVHIDNNVGLLVASNSGGVAHWSPRAYTEISPDAYTVLATTINPGVGSSN